MTAEFPDHFSGVAALYARSRPTYPAELFTWLASTVEHRGVVWDCATGSGQAAVALAALFGRTIASDASQQQLEQAVRAPGISYLCCTAESVPLADSTLDLITVAQALHWFTRDAFYAEVRRLLRPNGVIAAWTYGKCLVVGKPAITAILDDFHDRIVWPFWPPERSHVDSGYTQIDFPFARLPVPSLEMRRTWTLDELIAYLGSWSSVSRYQAECGADPRSLIVDILRAHWGDGDTRQELVWPLGVLAGRA